LTIAQTWELARRWYHDRLRPEFHGRSANEAQAIFQSLGLVSPAWTIHA
jgi:hypothetical protein